MDFFCLFFGLHDIILTLAILNNDHFNTIISFQMFRNGEGESSNLHLTFGEGMEKHSKIVHSISNFSNDEHSFLNGKATLGNCHLCHKYTIPFNWILEKCTCIVLQQPTRHVIFFQFNHNPLLIILWKIWVHQFLGIS